MKNLQYYVELEKTASDQDVGDMFDGHILMQNVKISMFTVDTQDFITQFDSPEVSLNLGYLKCPVFCMFMYDYRNHVTEELNGDVLTVRYQFTDEQKRKLIGFGDSVLIITNGNEFIERIKTELLAQNIGFSRDFVSYYANNYIDHYRQIKEDNSRVAFWKRKHYQYQQEYRFIAHTEVEDFLSVEIGDISDISKLMTTDELLNTYFKVDFNVKKANP